MSDIPAVQDTPAIKIEESSQSDILDTSIDRDTSSVASSQETTRIEEHNTSLEVPTHPGNPTSSNFASTRKSPEIQDEQRMDFIKDDNDEPETSSVQSNVVKQKPGTIASRSKRRTAKTVDYKEKSETDIPSATKIERHVQTPRRGKSSSDSATPPPMSSSTTSSASSSKNIAYFDVDDVVPINYQPPIVEQEFNVLLDLRGAKVDSTERTLILKNGQTIKKGDCIYMVCEPPTEPFYIAQVLGFTKKDKNSTNKKASNYMFSVCWFYRPRDLNRRLTDTRLVYASLHRDNCPLASFRGFATVKHKSEIDDLDIYRKQPDCFFFDKLYDRYMIKMYDMIPTEKLTHLPPNYYKALTKRFGYIFVEVGKADELLSSPKNCEKCLQWCSNSDSISCSGCTKSYHLLCLDPPILTKPKRGFAWYCAACNKHLEDQLAENRGKMLESSQPSMIMKHEARNQLNQEYDMLNNANNNNSETPKTEEADSSSLKYEQLAKKFLDEDKNVSFKKRREMEEWPYRYLGVHAKFEDALDLQDRPYARAASRLGSKYQCTSIPDWFNHPVQYYDTNTSSSSTPNKRLKKYHNRGKKSNTPLQIDEVDEYFENKKFPIPDEYKDLKPKEYPGWLQPKPKGYIERGGDDTSELLWEMPKDSAITEKEAGDMVEKYIKDCAPHAKRLKLTTVTTPNFIDAILLILMRHNYKPEECMDDVHKLTRDSLKEPTFTDEEVKRFEDSVRIHGSELYPVFLDVKTQTSAMVVRFYYLWKKTKSGHEIWDNFSGRAKNRLKSTKSIGGIDLDNPEDDGAYSNGKINRSQIKFKCIYCQTNHSPEWFRAPGATKDEANNTCEGFCYRCAKLWRKYASKWENPVELIKNQEKKSAYTVKKKVEYALIQEARLVVTARENYKLHPRKISDGLKSYKTIDKDLDYTTLDNDKPKKKSPKKITTKNTTSSSSPPPSSSSSLSVISKVSPSNTDQTSSKKEKKDIITPKKPNKRSKDSANLLSTPATKESNIDFIKSDSPAEVNTVEPKKKAAYKRRKTSDKGLKFIYGKVIGDTSKGSSSMKYTTVKKEAKKLRSNNPMVNRLREELYLTRMQFEENAKSSLFNAFLDMKLREKIESLEKELSLLTENIAPESQPNLHLEQQNSAHTVPSEQSIEPVSSPVISGSSSSRPSTKDSDNFVMHQPGRKYIRRRLFLSKTSVPGSGVFETPPIQLPMDANTALSTTTVPPNNLRNKFVFQMYDQNATKNEESDLNVSGSSTGTQFQSQPNLLPPQTGTVPSTITFNHPNSSYTGGNTSAVKSAKFTEASTPSNYNTLTTRSKRGPTSGSTVSKRKNAGTGFITKGGRSKEFVNLSPSFKIKMLTPLIDFNDRITKKMLSRYTTKFDVFNPLLSDDFYISPIYQMRPSSKELHVLWKQYQTSRKSRGKSGKHFDPLYPPDKRACCVCREFGDTSEMLICSNCGLNVHASCYGIKLDSNMEKKAGEYNWHCDTCSNDLHPLVSTQYVCSLCNSRESNMDNAIKGDSVSIPDALKRTIEGRWCHVTCSLLCDNVKYGSNHLQPIYGSQVTGVKNIFNSCTICLSNGGSIVKCEFCNSKSHVTCALDYGWKTGFKLLNIFDIPDGDVIQISSSNKIGKLKPIIYCDKHSSSEDRALLSIYSLCEKGRRVDEEGDEMTLLQLYSNDERKRVDTTNTALVRRKAFDEMNKQFADLVLKVRLSNDYAFEDDIEEPRNLQKCVKCSRTTSLVWYADSYSGGKLCHKCHVGENEGGEYEVPDLSSINNSIIS